MFRLLGGYEGEVGGIEAFDDSKGTNVGATVAALEGLGADKAPARLVVILGGDGKGQDFSPLTAPLQRHARAVATIGKDAAGREARVRRRAVPVLVRLADELALRLLRDVLLLPHLPHASLDRYYEAVGVGQPAFGGCLETVEGGVVAEGW